MEQGVFLADFADFIRAEGERVIGQIDRRGSLLGDGWGEWDSDSG